MRQYREILILAVILLAAVLILGLLGMGGEMRRRREGSVWELPSGSGLHVMYYVPDRDKPSEQIWLGGEQAAVVLAELGTVRLRESDGVPENVEGCTGLLVISSAADGRWIQVFLRDRRVAYVMEEGRWYVYADENGKPTTAEWTGGA